KLPGRIALGVGILAFIILLTWLILRYFRERKKAQKAIADWRENMDSANQHYMQLNDGYMGFLKDQGNWSEKFKGETLKRFKAAATDLAEFTARQNTANRLADEADKHAKRCYWPFVSGYRKAQALLTSEEIVITGKELPLEMSTLFGGLVAKTTYEPD